MESSRSSKSGVGSRLQPGKADTKSFGIRTGQGWGELILTFVAHGFLSGMPAGKTAGIRPGTDPSWGQRALELAEGKKEGSFGHEDELSNAEMASDNSSGGFSSWAKWISCLVKELRDLGRAQATQGMDWQLKLPGNGGEKHRTGGLVLYRNGTKNVQKSRNPMGFTYSLEITIQWEV